MTTKKVPFSTNFFKCELCDYSSSRKSHYDRHILTAKHKNREKYNQNQEKSTEKINMVCEFICDCGKSYPYRSSLYNHKKNCKKIINKINNETNIIQNDNKFLENEKYNSILKENEELKKQIIEILPKIGNNTTNIHNNNNFNINVFLNEKCKNAINMGDFIKSLEISLEQLVYTNKNGLVEGLSKSIVDNMNKLSIYERPLHCTDVKRETIYIKDNDSWLKDDNKDVIKDVIKDASIKNYNALNNWKEDNPDFSDDEKKSQFFSKTISTIGKSTAIIDEKIIKNLCKETYVK